jgi:hypothetical protein
VPKRCHRRPSPRCLLGRLGGDVMPKPCHKRLSLRCLPAQPTLAETVGTLVPGTRSASSSASPPSRHLPTGPARSSVGHRPRYALSISAQPTLADRPCTILTGAPSALCSALPPSRHLPTHSAHSFLARGQRHPQRLRPADTCRDSRHTRPPLPLMAIIPASVPSAINRTVSPAVEKSGEALASPAARNPSHGLASRGEIRRASRP